MVTRDFWLAQIQFVMQQLNNHYKSREIQQVNFPAIKIQATASNATLWATTTTTNCTTFFQSNVVTTTVSVTCGLTALIWISRGDTMYFP